MALIDEEKLQGRIFNILELLKKDINCCKVASTIWAESSTVGGPVFVVINQTGGITVYDQPGGTEITAYGTLTPPA